MKAAATQSMQHTDDPSAVSPYALTLEEVIAAVGTRRDRGLEAADAAKRLATSGQNAIPEAPRPSIIISFLKQFTSVLDIVLFAAAILSWTIGERGDALGILIAVMIDGVAGFVQERRAEGAVAALRKLVVSEATVLRDGVTIRIPAATVVVGDILVLGEGMAIAADARVIESRDLHASEAPLTGESEPVRKGIHPVREGSPVSERTSMLHMGTDVTSGFGQAVVTATGTHTEFGGIAASLIAIKRPKTPFELRVDRFARRIGTVSFLVAAVVFVLVLSRDVTPIEALLFSIAVLVSIIPEGLPAVLAVVLAIGVHQMAKRKVIVRNLPAVETLGSTDVICADKTGTITENKMTVRAIALLHREVDVTGEGWETEGEFSAEGAPILPAGYPAFDLLLRASACVPRAELSWSQEGGTRRVTGVSGDPTEAALLVAAAKGGLFPSSDGMERVDEIPFTSARKFRAALVRFGHSNRIQGTWVFAAGAYEVISERCVSVLDGGRKEHFAEDARKRFDAANVDMGRRTMRVLAVACKRIEGKEESLEDGDVQGMTFLGLVGMSDPPREGVREAIANCRKAGIRVLMLTGDHKETAVAVAREVGIVSDAKGVYTEHDLAAMDDAAFRTAVLGATVISRVSPEMKYRVVGAFADAGKVVAMTGDGVNDAPALKRSAVGIAMGASGTDVARQAADIVLTDDNFVSIVAAVEEGRVAFRNVRLTTAYLLMSNLGEVVTLVSGLLLGLPLILAPSQILWMNLVTDGLPDVALATERHTQDVLSMPPSSVQGSLVSRRLLYMSAVAAVITAAVTLYMFMQASSTGSFEHARSVAFTTLALSQLWNVFGLRTETGSVFKLGLLSNPFVTIAVLASFGMQVAVVHLPFLQKAFRTTALAPIDWLRIVVVSSVVLIAIEICKFVFRRLDNARSRKLADGAIISAI
jgi:Ca2+-transporting ATPase